MECRAWPRESGTASRGLSLLPFAKRDRVASSVFLSVSVKVQNRYPGYGVRFIRDRTGLIGAFTKPIGGALDFVSNTGKALLSHGDLIARIHQHRPRLAPATHSTAPLLALYALDQYHGREEYPELLYFCPLTHVDISHCDDSSQIFSFDDNIVLAITSTRFAIVSKAEVLVHSQLPHLRVLEVIPGLTITLS